MPKETKQLCYKKCGQCRKDRQKCLPEGRLWPGRRCDRCLKYGYLCSASETKSQESIRLSRRGSRNLQDPPSLRELSPEQVARPQRSEIQCLQDLGDIRQLIICFLELNQEIQEKRETILLKTLRKALQDVVKETEAWAQQYENDGRYKDAAYLHGRINSDLKNGSQIVPTMTGVYEKLGDYPAAELAQQELIEIISAEGWEDNNEDQTREVNTVLRLLNLFHTRIQLLGSASQSYAKLSIVYRAAILDLEQINIALFEQGLIVLDRCDEWNCCSLHVAAKKNAPNLTRLLLQKQADINQRDTRGVTPLHIAVRNGTEDIVRLLLNHEADTEIEDNNGDTVLQTALWKRRDEVILSLLIEKGANIEARDSLGRTPLGQAIVSDLPTIARDLIRYGADVNARCDVFNSLGTLLFEAVRQRIEWAVTLLLEGNADLQMRDQSGRQALYYAVRSGQESIVKVLLDHGATENATTGPVSNSGSTLLHCATIKPSVNILEMILKAGVDVNGQDLAGDTALHVLMRTDHPPPEQVVSLLLKHGAQVNIENAMADTPLNLAVRSGKARSVQMLLNTWAEPRFTNTLGETPLAMAQDPQNGSDPLDQENW